MLPDKSSRQESVSQINVDKMQQIIIGDKSLKDVVENIRTNVKEDELIEIMRQTVDAAANPSVSSNFEDQKLFAKRSALNQDQKGLDKDE